MSEGRRRPGGPTKTSRRFATVAQSDGTHLKIPVTKDVGTFIYIANDDGAWSKKPHVSLLLDLPYLTVGSVFELEELRPGHNMGSTISVQVVDERVRVSVYPTKYGQLKREIYCVEVIPDSEKSAAFAEEFGLGDGK